MTDGVSRAIEEIKGSVAEVVVSWKLANLETIWAAEFDFTEITISI